jgi:hypothetical protein
MAVAVVTALAAAVTGCAATAATDANEPNDQLESATALVAGSSLQGVLTADDADVFSSEAPAGAGVHSFVVTVRCDDPASIEAAVGASVPGAWEGVSWPGWEPSVSSDGVRVAGELREGTILVFLTGTAGTGYTVGISWD